MSVNNTFALASVPRGAGLLLPLLYRKIRDVALLRLRFCSILATKSASKSGAIPRGLFTEKPLGELAGVPLFQESLNSESIVI